MARDKNRTFAQGWAQISQTLVGNVRILALLLEGWEATGTF